MNTQPLVLARKIRLRRCDTGFCGRRDKAATKELIDKLGREIGDMQELLYANSRHALLLIFQGMDASGKDGTVRTVLHHVNPVGVETANFKVPSAEESAHDFLWRIHRAVPRRGNIGIFNRSHYEAVLAERVLGLVSKKVWSLRYRQIVDFERMLVENRVVVLKFFLHLGRDEQAARFRERLTNPKKHWKFSAADLITRRHWDAYQEAYEDMLNATSHPAARWHLIPADRNWYRDFLVATVVARALAGLKMTWPKMAKGTAKVRIR